MVGASLTVVSTEPETSLTLGPSATDSSYLTIPSGSFIAGHQYLVMIQFSVTTTALVPEDQPQVRIEVSLMSGAGETPSLRLDMSGKTLDKKSRRYHHTIRSGAASGSDDLTVTFRELSSNADTTIRIHHGSVVCIDLDSVAPTLWRANDTFDPGFLYSITAPSGDLDFRTSIAQGFPDGQTFGTLSFNTGAGSVYLVLVTGKVSEIDAAALPFTDADVALQATMSLSVEKTVGGTRLIADQETLSHFSQYPDRSEYALFCATIIDTRNQAPDTIELGEENSVLAGPNLNLTIAAKFFKSNTPVTAHRSTTITIIQLTSFESFAFTTTAQAPSFVVDVAGDVDDETAGQQVPGPQPNAVLPFASFDGSAKDRLSIFKFNVSERSLTTVPKFTTTDNRAFSFALYDRAGASDFSLIGPERTGGGSGFFHNGIRESGISGENDNLSIFGVNHEVTTQDGDEANLRIYSLEDDQVAGNMFGTLWASFFLTLPPRVMGDVTMGVTIADTESISATLQFGIAETNSRAATLATTIAEVRTRIATLDHVIAETFELNASLNVSNAGAFTRTAFLGVFLSGSEFQSAIFRCVIATAVTLDHSLNMLVAATNELFALLDLAITDSPQIVIEPDRPGFLPAITVSNLETS